MKLKLFNSLAVACVLLATLSPFGNTQTWTLHGPVSRNSHTAVWDPTTAQMIIFGGQETTTNTDLNDVWLGKTSTNLSDSFTAETPTGTLPPGRYGHVATFDPTSNRMTIFGGGLGQPTPCANDVWILAGANGAAGTPSWMAIAPTGTAPAPRIYAGGVYDPKSDSLIVFGGSNCSTAYFNDVWVLSDANGEAGTPAWTQLTTAGTPPAARESGSAIYDSTNNVLTIYGGDAGGAPFGDVWILSNANGSGGVPTWTQLSPTGTAPMARTGQTAIYDSVNDRMTIFGGIYEGITLTDSWVLTFPNDIGGTPAWSEIPTQGTAPSLAYHSAVYDSKLDNMYAFAGLSSASKLSINDHVFTLSGANGISTKGFKWFLGGPPVRYSHSAFFDSANNNLFVFAGAHSGTLLFNDYWEATDIIGSSNLNWTALNVQGTKPSPRWGHTGLYDSISNRMMVFGGSTGNPAPCQNDYHVLENANNRGGIVTWLAEAPSGTLPPIRTRHASVYVASSNTLIIFGGFNCSKTYYNDVWILNNANAMTGTPSWTELAPNGTKPTTRESSSAVYDPTTNSLIIYGGDKGGAPTADIWILSNANGTGGKPAWTELTPANNGPGARSGQTATYDSVNNVMTIYAGYNGTTLLGDTWTLSAANGRGGPANWTQLASGQILRFLTADYDPTSNQMITFGGATGIQPQDPSSDTYTLTDANGLP